MKVKLGTIYSSITGIRKIDNTVPPGKDSLTMSIRFCEPLSDWMDKIERQRIKLIEKYGKKDEKGNTYIKPDMEKWNNFIIDWNTLLETEQEIDIDLISKELIPLAGLTPSEVRMMKTFFKE